MKILQGTFIYLVVSAYPVPSHKVSEADFHMNFLPSQEEDRNAVMPRNSGRADAGIYRAEVTEEALFAFVPQTTNRSKSASCGTSAQSVNKKIDNKFS